MGDLSSLATLVADIGIGLAALAMARSAKALAASVKAKNDSQDDRLDKLVVLAENHEKRILRLELHGRVDDTD